MINSSTPLEKLSFLLFVNLVLLGRPPWLTRMYKSIVMWLFTCVYLLCFALYVLGSAMKIRMEYRLCAANSIHFVTMGHDIFSVFWVCYFVLYWFAKQPDQSVKLCAEFRIQNVKSFFQGILIFAPASLILFINLYWQSIAFPTERDLLEATFYHAFSILVWNGLWIYTCVRIYVVYHNLHRLSIETKLKSVETLNNEIGLYLLLLFAKSVFDTISSLTFYSIQESSLPQVLLLHEVGLIAYDLLFCAVVAELSSRMSREIKSDFLREAPILTKASGSTPWTPLLQTALLPQGLDAFGVFTINRYGLLNSHEVNVSVLISVHSSLFVTMCGTTLTFLLILVQLSPDVQRKIRMNQLSAS